MDELILLLTLQLVVQQEECQLLRHCMSKAQTTIDQLQLEAADVDAKYKLCEQRTHSLMDENDGIRNDMNRLQQEHASLQAMHAELNTFYAALYQRHVTDTGEQDTQTDAPNVDVHTSSVCYVLPAMQDDLKSPDCSEDKPRHLMSNLLDPLPDEQSGLAEQLVASEQHSQQLKQMLDAFQTNAMNLERVVDRLRSRQDELVTEYETVIMTQANALEHCRQVLDNVDCEVTDRQTEEKKAMDERMSMYNKLQVEVERVHGELAAAHSVHGQSMNAVTIELDGYKNDCVQLQNQCTLLMADIDGKEKTIHQLKQSEMRLTEQILVTSVKNEHMNEILQQIWQEYQLDNIDIDSTLNNLPSIIRQIVDRQISAVQGDLDELNDRFATVQQQLNESRTSKSEEVSRHIHDLQSSQADEVARLTEHMRQMAEEIVELQKQCVSEKGQVERFHSELESAKERIQQEHVNEIGKLSEQLTSVQSELNETRMNLVNAQRVVDEQASQVVECTERISVLEREYAACCEERENVYSELKLLMGMKHEMDIIREKERQAVETIGEIKHDNESLKMLLVDKQSVLDTLTSTVGELQNQNGSLQQDNQSLTENNVRLTSEFKSMQDESDGLRQQQRVSDDEKQALHAEHQRLLHELKSIHEQKMEVERLRQSDGEKEWRKMTESNSQIEAVTSQLSAITDAHNQLQRQLQVVNEELAECTSKMSNAMTERDTASRDLGTMMEQVWKCVCFRAPMHGHTPFTADSHATTQ
jgi:chromosome segregation ATPase